jgi:hypothetical protein
MADTFSQASARLNVFVNQETGPFYGKVEDLGEGVELHPGVQHTGPALRVYVAPEDFEGSPRATLRGYLSRAQFPDAPVVQLEDGDFKGMWAYEGGPNHAVIVFEGREGSE